MSQNATSRPTVNVLRGDLSPSADVYGGPGCGVLRHVNVNSFDSGRAMKPSTTATRGLCLLAVLGLAAGCDFLSTEPKGVLTTENFFKTSDQAVAATNATYNMLREWQVHVFSWLGLTDIVSDDATKGSTPGDASFLGDLDNLTFDPGNLAFADPWAGYYKRSEERRVGKGCRSRWWPYH